MRRKRFPFVRRRGPLALIGAFDLAADLAVLATTGRRHGEQLARLDGILADLAAPSGCFESC